MHNHCKISIMRWLDLRRSDVHLLRGFLGQAYRHPYIYMVLDPDVL
jgi:hypothetical protein